MANLPTKPVLDLDAAPRPDLQRAALIAGQPGLDLYRLPKDFQSADLCNYTDPPKALGAFWTQPKGR